MPGTKVLSKIVEMGSKAIRGGGTAVGRVGRKKAVAAAVAPKAIPFSEARGVSWYLSREEVSLGTGMSKTNFEKFIKEKQLEDAYIKGDINKIIGSSKGSKEKWTMSAEEMRGMENPEYWRNIASKFDPMKNDYHNRAKGYAIEFEKLAENKKLQKLRKLREHNMRKSAGEGGTNVGRPKANLAGNSIQGMNESGISPVMRKSNTDFGSPWKGLFKGIFSAGKTIGKTVFTTGRGLYPIAKGGVRFAKKHPYITGGMAGLGAYGLMHDKSPYESPTLEGEINPIINQSAAANELMSIGVAPMGSIQSAKQVKNRMLMNSTYGLVQGMHRGRH